MPVILSPQPPIIAASADILNYLLIIIAYSINFYYLWHKFSDQMQYIAFHTGFLPFTSPKNNNTNISKHFSMKKLLLLGAAAVAVSSASAMEPQEWADQQILSISPNGTYSAAEYVGSITLINNETGESTTLEGDEMLRYTLGMGNSVSNNGIVVGSFGNYPGYMKDGEWHNLKTDFPQNVNNANGITPDGTRICGTAGTAAMTTEDTPVPMQSPVVWTLQADGTYSDPVMLPYPQVDYTNRLPQYVTALAISDDGKTVSGLMTDYQGFMTTLLYYTLNDNNEWVMHDEFGRLANPNNVPIPEFPGDCEEGPSLEDFMTAEEKQAYEDALTAWTESGTWDYSTYPNLEDFMTDEEKAAYEAAYNKWNTEVYAPWQAATDEFYEAIAKCNGTSLTFNNTVLSGDGKTVIATAQLPYDDPNSFDGVSYADHVAKFDLDGDTYVTFEEADMNGTAIAGDGTVLSYARATTPDQAWVYLPGTTKDPVSIMNYVKERDEDMYEWMQEKMVHDLEAYDMETWELIVIADYEFTGIPLCGRNLNVFSCMTSNYWDYSSDVYSFVIPMGGADSVKGIGNDSAAKVMLFKGGRIVVEGDVQAVNVYDLSGRKVFSTGAASGTIATGLSNGTFVVRVTTADGVQTRKAIF